MGVGGGVGLTVPSWCLPAILGIQNNVSNFLYFPVKKSVEAKSVQPLVIGLEFQQLEIIQELEYLMKNELRSVYLLIGEVQVTMAVIVINILNYFSKIFCLSTKDGLHLALIALRTVLTMLIFVKIIFVSWGFGVSLENPENCHEIYHVL